MRRLLVLPVAALFVGALLATDARAAPAARAQSGPPSWATARGHRGFIPRRAGTHGAVAKGLNPFCGGCQPPLVYNINGISPPPPVMGGITGTPGVVTITPVYWAPAGYSYTPTYKSIINGYLHNVALASNTRNNVFSISTQYYQQPGTKHIHYQVTAGAEVDDTSLYSVVDTKDGCNLPTGYLQCVSDTQLRAHLKSYLPAHAQPVDDAHLYMVFFPQRVNTCANGLGCFADKQGGFCAYHDAAPIGTVKVPYSNQPFVADPAKPTSPADIIATGCSGQRGPQAPNGDAYADAQLNLASHEANEAITNTYGAWQDRGGYENGDNCAWVFGQPLGSTNAQNPSTTLYNQAIGTGRYYTQDEFSNEDFALGQGDMTDDGKSLVAGCQQREELVSVTFSPPSGVLATVAATFHAVPHDPDNTSAKPAYKWQWGDGSANSSGASPSHTFAAPGSYTVKLTATFVDGWTATDQHAVSVGAAPKKSGYWMLGSDGRIFPFGDATHLGSAPPVALAIAARADGTGYWILNLDGSVRAFGSATFAGDHPVLGAGDSVSTIANTPSGRGYWIFTRKGRAFVYGDARFYGDMSHVTLGGPIVASVATPTGHGYYMVGSDGGIFSFGDAKFHGSMGGAHLNKPVVGIAPTPANTGYWLVASDGGVFAFNAPFRGSMGGTPLTKPVNGLVAFGNGYLMVASDGGVFNFSDEAFLGSLGGQPLLHPIVGIAAFAQ
jgi:PKD domain-containing protein